MATRSIKPTTRETSATTFDWCDKDCAEDWDYHVNRRN